MDAIDSLTYKFASRPSSSYVRQRSREKQVSTEIFDAISDSKLTSSLSNVLTTRNQDGTYLVNINTERGRILDQSKLLTEVINAGSGYAVQGQEGLRRTE